MILTFPDLDHSWPTCYYMDEVTGKTLFYKNQYHGGVTMFNLIPYRRRSPGSWFRDFLTEDIFGGLSTIKADIFTEGGQLVIEAELPGFNKEEIKVKVNDRQLTISAQRKNMSEEKAEDYIRRERNVSQVCRTFIIEDLDADKIQASFENGLLRLTVPKPQELEPKIREIDIE